MNTANHPWKREDFAQQAPGVDRGAYFAAARLGEQKDFIVWQPRALTAMSALVANEPLATWKDYLVVQALDSHAFALSRPFAEESFASTRRTSRALPTCSRARSEPPIW